MQPYRHVAELYEGARRVTRIDVAPSWFQPPGPDGALFSGFGRTPPNTRVRGGWQDSSGRLWLVSLVPRQSWHPDVDWRPGRPTARSVDELFGSIVEVYEAATGRKLAEARYEEMIAFVLGDGRCATYREEDTGPSLAVSRFELVHLTSRRN